MISDILGLSINQKVLNKKSPSSVVSTLEKTATNYIAIGRMVEDLKLIRLNFSRWIAIEGAKVRGRPDMHMLKEDELTKKFNVQREKYSQSKVTRVGGGTEDKKGLGRKLLELYIERKVERKIAARVLNFGRKFTTVRKFIRLKRKLLVIVNRLIGKINIKKMFMNWVKNNYKKFLKPFIDVFSNALKRFVKKGLQKLIARFSIATLSSLWSGPFAPVIGAVIVIGLMVFQPLLDAWEEYSKGGDFFETFIVGLMDEFSFGLFEKSDLKDFKNSFVSWYENLFKSAFDTIDKSIKFIEEKVTSFGNFIIDKFKSMLVTKDNKGDFLSAVDELNKKRIEDEAKQAEKYPEYFKQMNEKIRKQKVNIRLLEIEIFNLEEDLKALVKGPEDKRLEEVKQEKQDEVAALNNDQVGAMNAPPPKAAPTPTPAPKKQEVAAMRSDQVSAVSKGTTPTQTTGQYEKIKQMVIANEGWKNKVYKDSRGLWTIGVGHLIGDGKKMPFEENGIKFTKDTELSNQQVRELFEKDFGEHLKLAEKAPGWDKANEAGKAGLIDLTYNMGGYWYTKFKKAATLLSDGKFKEAADEFKKSAWYKQVGERAPATVSLIRSGAANDKEGAAALASVMSSSKVASAGKFVGESSTQVAQAQREQMKPKDANVVNIAKTNNNKVNQQENVAMSKPGSDASSTMSNRAAA